MGARPGHGWRGVAAIGVLASLLNAAPSARAQALSAVRVASIGGSLSFNDLLTGVAQPPSNVRDLFVISKQGLLIRVHDGVTGATPVLDLSASLPPQNNENGLLGIAFHPRFQTNGYIYLCYTGYLPGSTSADPGVHIIRGTLDPSDPGAIIAGSIYHLFSYQRDVAVTGHFGGWIGFGPDGYLYLSAGDGGQAVSQNVASLLGKILRIDVDHDDFPADPVANYAIPPSNPFYGSPSARGEVWAMGLRNPWRCSFDRLTGDLWIGDVGGNLREEVDFQPAIGLPPYQARNYGWPCMEGTLCQGGGACVCNSPGLTLPVYEYAHAPSQAVVIGGYVYRGAAVPALQGAYVFGDEGPGVWSFRLGPSGVTEFRDHTTELASPPGHTSFGEGTHGELYFCSGFAATSAIYQIRPACYANCDQSVVEPRLSANDFVCFMNQFAVRAAYANCDQSTTLPIFNVADFVCFTQQFAAGCP
jgi:glucose/arabinose dehydrogenase